MATAVPNAASAWRHRPVAVHTHTQVLGLVLIAGALLLTVAAALATGVPASEAAFLLAPFAGALIGAAVAYRFGTGGRAVGLLLGLGAAAMTFFLGFGVLAPSSFIEFTTGTAFVLGVVLLLYGGVASLVRRADVRAETPRSEQLLDRTAVAVVVLAFLVSLPLWLTSRTTVDAAAAAGLQEVTASSFAFEDVTASAGESIVVRNEDAFHHTFTIDELGIDVELLPGSAAIVDLPAEPGTYTYYCIPHSAEAGAGEDDMAATLTIE